MTNIVVGKTRASSGRQRDWARLVFLGVAVFLLFLYTRACHFHSGLYWDLLMGREFSPAASWTLTPERISFLISQSAASLIGLKAIYHLFFFILCSFLARVVFKGEEVIPGLIVLAVFAFAMQPLMSLRDMIQALLIITLLNSYREGRFRDRFGLILFPLALLSCILGLGTWMIFALVLCQVLFRRKHSFTQWLCVIMGMLVFLDADFGWAIGVKPLAALFPDPEKVKLISMLAGIFLVPNVLGLPVLLARRLPEVVFYVILGFSSLFDVSYLPVFSVVGMLLLTDILSGLPGLSLNATFSGMLVLVVILHLFLLLNPMGFRLHPHIRGELGPDLGPLLTGQTRMLPVFPHEVGELAWKGIITLTEDDFPLLKRLPRILLQENLGKFSLSESDFSSPTTEPKSPGTPGMDKPEE
jgi:hypothetical protein